MNGRAELFRALGALAEPPEASHEAIAGALGLPGRPAPGEHVEVFLLGAFPYASVYLGADGMLGGEARDRVAGFWRALGLVPPPEPDHLAALLGLHAALIDAEAASADPLGAEAWRSSRTALLWEHLLSWLPPWLDKVAELGSPYYAAWAGLVREAIMAEADELGRQDRLPLALRQAAGLPPPEATAGEWLGALLTPARSGMIVTRQDIRRAGRELDLASRVADRAAMLRAMFGQDPDATVGWLAGEARRSARRRRADELVLGDVAMFWSRRALACAEALDALGRSRAAAAGS